MDNLIEMTMTVQRAERMLESLRDIYENVDGVHTDDAEQLLYMINRLEFLIEDQKLSDGYMSRDDNPFSYMEENW